MPRPLEEENEGLENYEALVEIQTYFQWLKGTNEYNAGKIRWFKQTTNWN